MDRQALRETLLNLLEQETWERPENFADDLNLRTGLKLDSVDLLNIVVLTGEKVDFAAQAAAEEADDQARLAKKAKRLAKKPAAGVKAVAAESASPAVIVEDAKTGRASLSLKPASASAVQDRAPKAIPAKADGRPAGSAKGGPKKPDVKSDVKADAKPAPQSKAEAKTKADTKTN